jgi:membrane protein insertase Oxa1/YidC/SpoIIIJ
MKLSPALVFTTVIGATLIGGCASPAMTHSSDSMQNMSKADGDMASMCTMHKKMMAMSPQDRQAMMEQHMKGMSPEMHAKEMEKMKNCM